MVVFVLLFFLSPAVVIFLRAFDWRWPLTAEVLAVLQNNFLQATMSAGLSVVLAFAGACGLLAIQNVRWRRWLEIFVLLPGVLPALFVLLAVLNGFSGISPFPYGITGVVLVHVVTYWGLLSVAWVRLIENKAGNLIELATIDGLAPVRAQFLIFRYLRQDALFLFYLVFASAFTSFSVPLIVGGHRGETLDVLIYRSAFGSGDWGLAISLSLVQILFLFILSLFSVRPQTKHTSWPRNLGLISSPTMAWGLILPHVLLLVSSLKGVSQGLDEILSHTVLLQNLLLGWGGSLLQCVLVAGLCFVLSCAVIYLLPSITLHRFLLGYVAPSSAVTGLAVSIYFDPQHWGRFSTLVIMAVAFVLLIYPSVYRLRGASAFSSFGSQVEQAVVLGLNRWQRFRMITLPQLWPEVMFMSGVGAFWASGDFALARMISGQDITLALTAQSLLGGYRLEVATAVMWCSLLSGVFIFLICDRLGRASGVVACPK